MSDPRLTPANGRVAHVSLRGQVAADAFVEGEPMQVWGEPFLLDAPEGRRDRQRLHGDAVRVLERRDGWAFVRSEKDAYCGYLPEAALRAPGEATHRVAVRQTHLYPAPEFKQPPIAALSMSARLRVVEEEEPWARVDTPEGEAFVPTIHICSLDRVAGDMVTLSEAYLGTPYLWGGNGAGGIDCSGLVQVACHMANIACPGDSDQQMRAVGKDVPIGSQLLRGDLLFWEGHVAIALDEGTIIHANAHHMAVVTEDFAEACRRIEAAGGGPVTAHRRT